MPGHNYFSDKFKNKNSTGLLKVIEQEGFTIEAKLAAIWELEKRNEANEEHKSLETSILHKMEIEAENTRLHKRYHTIWQRCIATGIDGLIMVPVTWLITFLIRSNSALLMGSILINSFFPLIYSIYMHGKYGQTLGKMYMKIKVVDYEKETAIDFRQAFTRDAVAIAYMALTFVNHFAYMITERDVLSLGIFSSGGIVIVILAIWSIAELFTMLFNKKFRALHDLIAETVVIRI